MRKVDPVKHEGKRQEILDAAVKCFVQHGFQGASIAHICAEAGMSAGHLYHYFHSKDAIIKAIVESNLKRAEEKFAEAAEQTPGVMNFLLGQLHQSTHGTGRRAPLFFDMFAETGRNLLAAEMLEKHSRRMRSLMVDLLRHGQSSGEVDQSLDPEIVAPVLISMLDGAKTLAMRNPNQPIDQLTDVLHILLSNYLSSYR